MIRAFVERDDLYYPSYSPLVGLVYDAPGLKDDIECVYFTNFIPTAENLAKYWYQQMKFVLEQKNIKIHHVTVWETPSSSTTCQI